MDDDPEDGQLNLIITGPCQVCNQAPSKYRCPGCNTLSCSLACSQLHKRQSGCQGRRTDRSYHTFTPLSNLTSTALQDDAQLLDETRSILRNRPPSTRLPSSPFPAGKNSRLREACQGRNINWQMAPVGLERQRRNQSQILRDGSIRWTVEWLIIDSCSLSDHPLNLTLEQLRSHIKATHYTRVHESQNIGEALPKLNILDNTEFSLFLRLDRHASCNDCDDRDKGENASTKVVLDSGDGQRRLWEIPNPFTMSPSSILAYRNIIEFPSIYVIFKNKV